MTGSASRKTDPHQKNSSMRPPRTGPTALPALKPPIQTPMAIERSFGSLNMWKMSDSVDGASVAPASPSSARLAMSISALTENAASTENTPKTAAPMRSRRRRPIRSPRVPIVIRAPATMKP